MRAARGSGGWVGPGQFSADELGEGLAVYQPAFQFAREGDGRGGEGGVGDGRAGVAVVEAFCGVGFMDCVVADGGGSMIGLDDCSKPQGFCAGLVKALLFESRRNGRDGRVSSLCSGNVEGYIGPNVIMFFTPCPWIGEE